MVYIVFLVPHRGHSRRRLKMAGDYIIVNNIPPFYHSSDLRNYFSQFVESEAFICFHFKHRPEVKAGLKPTEIDGTANEPTDCSSKTVKTFCCVAKIKSEETNNFLKSYNKKHWLNEKNESIPALCYVSKIKVQDDSNSKYSTSI